MNTLQKEILELKEKKKAIILAHNYQRPEVQDIADFIGDSIELCRKAQRTDARIIVFCGVDFMAQSGLILNPNKEVLIPSLGARCPMAQMLPLDYFRLWKQRYPNIPTVLYVNTLGEAKAECDVCCTSANAVELISRLEEDTILFGPDRHLSDYVAKKTKKQIISVPPQGFCPVHVLFNVGDLTRLKNTHKDAPLIVHPECPMDIIELADYVGSTSQMCKFVKESLEKKFIVATEIGLIHRLEKENPDKTFIPAYEEAICTAMRANTLEDVYLSLKEERYKVSLSKEVLKGAKKSLEKMVEVLK